MATKRVTVTIPEDLLEDLLEEIRSEVTERGLPAYFSEAPRLRREPADEVLTRAGVSVSP